MPLLKDASNRVLIRRTKKMYWIVIKILEFFSILQNYSVPFQIKEFEPELLVARHSNMFIPEPLVFCWVDNNHDGLVS